MIYGEMRLFWRSHSLALPMCNRATGCEKIKPKLEDLYARVTWSPFFRPVLRWCIFSECWTERTTWLTCTHTHAHAHWYSSVSEAFRMSAPQKLALHQEVQMTWLGNWKSMPHRWEACKKLVNRICGDSLLKVAVKFGIITYPCYSGCGLWPQSIIYIQWNAFSATLIALLFIFIFIFCSR